MRTNAVLCAFAVSGILAASPANALNVNYDVSIQAAVSPTASCTSGVSVVECNLTYSSAANPIDGFMLGGFNRVTLQAHAQDGPVGATSTGAAEFSVLSAGKLLRARNESTGQFVTQDCVPNDAGGVNCYTANAWVFSSTTHVSLVEGIHAIIPASLDGSSVSAKLTIPVSAYGTGSSYGQVFARLAGPSGGTNQTLEMGNLNFNGASYDFNQALVLDIPIRSASDSSRDVLLDFGLDSQFRSSTLNGPGFIDATNSIGFSIASASGVTFRSVSGDLDPLLTSAPVPEPDTAVLMLAGLVPIALIVQRRRYRTRKQMTI